MPRAGLTRAIVVAEAARLADEAGWDRLTLAALAARLGVRVPSLYKHVGGLDAVRRGVTIQALGELGAALASGRAATTGRATPATDGWSRLHGPASAYRAYATAHPGRYAATVRAAPADDAELTAASDAVVAIVFDVLAELGLIGDAATDAARAMRAALHGFVAIETAGGFGLPRDVDRSFDAMIHTLERGFRSES